ncbi:sensor histidine kinase [Croceivirga thetidis]|uniref:Histidine kinase n=1 Tax=Croceivirga thetidis TaxID=2721623 RepID=A0ABX1GVW5_9FLAO|nr:histidine kinase [Croceivirga thetidis]NKI33156.1 histidine kinase [Croceivirga thetidis]
MLFKNQKPILGFDDRLLVIIGVLLNTHTVMAIYYTSAFFTIPFKPYITRWFGEFLVVLALWLVIRWLYLVLLKKSPGLKNQKKRFLIIPLLLIPYFIISFFYIYLVQPYFSWEYEQFTEPLVAVQIITGIITFFVDIGVYEGLHLFVELKDTHIKEEKLLKEKSSAELMVFKNQMDPHFLFNSLTTILHLIDTDSERAKKYVYKLSEVYKGLLQNNSQNLIELKEEIYSTKVYSELVNERFGNNLNVDFEVSKEDLKRMIVPFSLQVAVENAIKHNVISNKKPLTIRVFTDNEYLIVENSLQLKKLDKNQEGFGLKNISEQYKLLSDKAIIVEENQNTFVLKLPLLGTKTKKRRKVLANR